ncbi:helix-turn-helix domain-containing protein [Rhodobacter sp. 24-YEA-8]|uniref:AraC-like ligand-binding domain-containing protein n=1 Tax=Rhodobacter sp. 24-YEA-8 TaxID=1884310 RepID=UPI000896CF29|nr:helix-turn-helix domain-containing protein [Rhodobacter sp. 24-YEA-8]SED47810.1 transcriptional regulator, AraC family [Rhodobacter sp. 24-YEA-8]
MQTVSASEDDSALLVRFRAAAKQCFGRLSVTPADTRQFSGEISYSGFAFLGLIDLQFQPIQVERTSTDIAADTVHDYFLTLQVEGAGTLRQLGREITLYPGDFAIVDSSLPSELHFSQPARRIAIRLPRAELKRRGGVTQNICARAYRGKAGTSAMTSAMILSTRQHAGAMGQPAHHLLASALLDLVMFSEAEDARPGVSCAGGEMLQRLRAIVLSHLSDPDLGAGQIAAYAGISVRYMHKLFSDTGTSVNRWIQDQRLAICHLLLSDPAHAHRSIGEIAYANGFNDAGYFSQLFSRKYGISPSRLRAGQSTSLC